MDVKLRLVQFCERGGGCRRVGVELVSGGGVVDVCAVDSTIPKDMRTFLQQWDTSAPAAARCIIYCTLKPGSQYDAGAYKALEPWSCMMYVSTLHKLQHHNLYYREHTLITLKNHHISLYVLQGSGGSYGRPHPPGRDL